MKLVGVGTVKVENICVYLTLQCLTSRAGILLKHLIIINCIEIQFVCDWPTFVVCESILYGRASDLCVWLHEMEVEQWLKLLKQPNEYVKSDL